MRDELAVQPLGSYEPASKRSERAELGASSSGPTSSVLVIALFQVALWGVLSGFLAVAPPDDSLEQVLLSQDLRLAYGKHPPLPTWILFAANRVFGPSIGATFVLGALCAVATMLLLYAFARPLVGAPRAALAAILLSNIEYLSAGATYYNHNTVQLPLAMLAIMLFHRALTRMRWFDWAMFGLGCGLLLLAKLSAVVLFASFAVYLFWAGHWRSAPVLQGLAVAAAAATFVISPYLVTAHGDRWAPDAYAWQSVFPGDVSRLESLKTVWGFGSSQLAKVAPALLIFMLLRRSAPKPEAAPDRAVALVPFLTLVGFGPFVLTVVIAALTGAHLLVGWGATFHILLTVWLVAAKPLAIEAPAPILRRAVLASVAVQLVLWALMTTHGGRLPNLNPTPHPVPAPTPALLEETIRDTWAQRCAAPLRFVLTDLHTGAALALRYRGQPRVVDATRPESTRFFSEDARNAAGAVVVMPRPSASATPGVPPSAMEVLLADAKWRTSVELTAVDGRRHEYLLGILSPSVGDGCAY
ncbi:MAG: glycosyltransferase family 39 protein [Burkholderiaceae bacterium]